MGQHHLIPEMRAGAVKELSQVYVSLVEQVDRPRAEGLQASLLPRFALSITSKLHDNLGSNFVFGEKEATTELF